MKKYLWKDQSYCLDYDQNLFFDTYEEKPESRKEIDDLCRSCSQVKICFATGVSGKEWGVWGGIYLEDGEISKEFNNHKTKPEWSETWKSLTLEK